jgi:transcriptional regulator with XRE-family HTH domain
MKAVGRPPVKGVARHAAIGSRIWFERLTRGVSRASISEHLGVDVSVYAKIELGQVALTFDKADQIASFIGVPITRLRTPLSEAESVRLAGLKLRDRKRKRAA